MTLSTENTTPPLRIGILGAARIARKNIAAIKHEASNCIVVAVASRSAAKANDLIANYVNVPTAEHLHIEKVKVFSGNNAYNDLLASVDLVDAVYIPLPTTLKKEWTIRALRSKKHVLVEKPVAPSAEDYREMIYEAKLAKRYLMDGTMFVHHPRTDRFLSHIISSESSNNASSSSFGAVTGIDAAFTILGNDDFMKNNIRMKKNGDFQGCIGDLGWYCIRLAQLTFRGVGVGSVKSAQVSDWKLNEEGVPIDATCLVTFQADDVNADADSNLTLSFHCSYLHPWNQRGEVYGTKETAQVMGFINPKDGTVSFQTCNKQTPSSAHKTGGCVDVHVPCEVPQITLMWSKFREYCKVVEKSGWADNDEASACILSEMSWENQLIVDALMESVGGNGKAVKLPMGTSI
mmetsp:Transcript_5163/g.11338  ORF Transcript_5163/g.11338 Transcript_5163/m.11338 type:complete len:405 (+) Transcript_5163:28-1242(+)